MNAGREESEGQNWQCADCETAETERQKRSHDIEAQRVAEQPALNVVTCALTGMPDRSSRMLGTAITATLVRI